MCEGAHGLDGGDMTWGARQKEITSKPVDDFWAWETSMSPDGDLNQPWFVCC